MPVAPLPSRSLPAPGTVRLVALGGLGEVGMNCMVVESRDDLFVLDCGVTFPEKTYGADIQHARFDYIRERRDRVRAIVVTHGHEDHVGAVPYLLREVRAPVYAPPYALGILRRRLDEVEVPDTPELHPLVAGRSFGIGADFELELFRVHHSLPEAHGVIIRGPAGTILHTGDFKIEASPAPGQHFDRHIIERASREGIRLMLSDSTNIDVEGRSGLEQTAHEAMLELVSQAEGRVVIGSFASNSFRIASVLDIARKTGRRLGLLGRSMWMHGRLQEELGHVEGLSKRLVQSDKLRHVPRGELLLLATGTQGEPPAALARLAKGIHPDLELQRGDEVVLASRVIPGCEVEVHTLIDAFERRGLVVHHRRTEPRLHASGHAAREEQREMLELVRPESFMPVHGTFHHLSRHAELARETGVRETLVVENGTVVEVGPDTLRAIGTVPTGVVQCAAGEPIPDVVLKERSLIARYGTVSVAVSANREFTRFGPPRIRSRGLLDDQSEDDRSLVREAERFVARELRERVGDFDHEGDVEHVLSRRLRRFFQDEIGVKPVVDVLVLTTP